MIRVLLLLLIISFNAQAKLPEWHPCMMFMNGKCECRSGKTVILHEFSGTIVDYVANLIEACESKHKKKKSKAEYKNEALLRMQREAKPLIFREGFYK